MHFTERHPRPDDLLLLIEVSDTTLRFDLSAKADLYARAGIREYWVIDIPGRRLIVHRQPDGAAYQEILVYSADETAACLVLPESPVQISALLPRV